MIRDKIIPNGLYGITGEKFSNGKSNFQCVKEMIKGGIKIIQYREKDKSMKEKIKEAKAIRELCRDNGVLFIVNDHVDLALLVDADGVHIGQDDMTPADVRKLVGKDKIIGLSTHSPEQAFTAYYNKDVDYIGVGPIYPTTTKDAEPVGLDYLDFVTKNIDMPFVAIGGIKTHNINEIISRGAHTICMVSEVVSNDNIAEFVKKYTGKITL